MRARNIKPAFFTNDSLVELPALTRLLYIGLWCAADRRGLVEDRPKRLKMEILPADDIDVDKALAALEAAGHIERYVGSNGVGVVKIKRFKDHQRPHHEEKPNPKLEDRAAEALEDHPEANLGSRQPGEGARQPGESTCQPALIPDSGFLNADTGSLNAPATAGGGAESFALSPPAALLMPVREGDEPIHQHEVTTWAGLYGNVDVPDALNRMRGHWLSKPANQRKTRKGIRTSINTWLARDHDRAKGNPRASPPPGADGRAQRTKAAMAEVLNELRGGGDGGNH